MVHLPWIGCWDWERAVAQETSCRCGALRIKVGKTEKANGRPFAFSVLPTLILRAAQGRPNGALGFGGALGISVRTPDRARN